MKLSYRLLLVPSLFAFSLLGSAPAPAQPATGPGAIDRIDQADEIATVATEDLLSADGPTLLDPQAAYHFAVAKMLLSEGDVRRAIESFDQAVALEPDEPYLRLEYADLLSRLAQSQRTAESRERQWQRAARQIDAARRVAPDNLDVLVATGDVFLALADFRTDALGVAVGALEQVREQAPWKTDSLVALGQAYQALGNPGRAADVFSNAIDYTPNSRLLYTFLADALLEAERFEEAEEALEGVLELHPEDLDTRIRIVDSRSRRGDHGAALELLRAVSEEQRSATRVRVLEARELFLADRSAEALTILDDLDEPDEAFRFYVGNLRAAVLADLGHDADALEAYRELVSLDPDNAEVVRTMANLLRDQGRRAEAIEVLAGFLQRAGRPAETEPALETVSLSLAFLYIEDENWKKAEQVARPVLGSTNAANRQAAVLTVAEVLHRSGRTQRALDLLDRRGGEAPQVAGKRAEILLDDDRPEAAEALLRSTKAAEPLLAVVQAFQATERYEATLPVLQRLVDEYPHTVPAWFLLGAGSERTGDRRRAAGAFERLLEINPNHAPTLNYLGYMWAEDGVHLDRALSLIERALDLDPDNGAFIDSLGWAKHRLGRHQEALEDLQRAARLIPGDPVIHDHLGDVYAALGQDREAAASYRRALNLAEGGDLDPVVVRRKLDRLEDDGSRR